MSRTKVVPRWTTWGWALGIALSGAAVVRTVRPERSTIDIAITAATPWLLAPSGALLAGALLTRRPSLAAALVAYQAKCTRPVAQAPRQRRRGCGRAAAQSGLCQRVALQY